MKIVDIISPAYKEVDNIEDLVVSIEQALPTNAFCFNLYIVDDNSEDGTVEVVDKLNRDWVHLITRTEGRGLSSAVIAGLNASQAEFKIVMDADLSHPATAIPKMIDELNNGADFVVGSRYIEDGSTDDDWGFFRWVNSKIATLLARPLTYIKDPMSGFFAIKAATYENAAYLNPIGYKIGLELIVKARCKKVVEVPIHFTDRVKGESKLSLKEQLKYIQHLRRLYIFKYGSLTEMFHFAVVGGSGVVVNLAVFTLMLQLGMGKEISILSGIIISVISNFLLNRRFTFSYAKNSRLLKSFITYSSSVTVGAIVNYFVTLFMLKSFPDLLPQLSATAGIAFGMVFNFVALKYLVFKKSHFKAK